MKTLRGYLLVILTMITPLMVDAQCAMCRTQVVNNVSHGETSLAAGLNLGILYLFFTPYLVIGIVAFLWFKKAKVNERKRGLAGRNRG